jgi:hypothetical protein
MPRVTQCKHEFQLDVPHFFSKQDDLVEEYYKILLLESADSMDPEIFVHLVCSKCYDEGHTVMDVEELAEILRGAKIIQSKLKLL